jgi:type I restriction enzyme S subunit
MDVEALLGDLPDGWKYSTLGDVCRSGGGDIQTGPFGSQLHKSDYVLDGIPSIMPQNIGDNCILEDGIARITQADADRLARYRVLPGDIVYSRRGDVEKRALVREPHSGWLCGTGCLRVRLGSKGPNPSYTAFYLGHPAVREWIVRHAHGATMPNLNTSILSSCPFVIPSKAEQAAIADTLGALDDKIELNRQTNETLEALARAIFKDWFVDFGPTRAKAEGREPYLAPELWDLFPDALDDEDKPVRWGRCELQDLVELNPREPLKRGAEAPYLDMAALPTSGSICAPAVSRTFSSGTRFRNGDTLLARITPCLENGKTAFVQSLPGDRVGWGSTEFIVLRARSPVPMAWTYLLARDPTFRAHAIQSMTGTSGRQRVRTEALAAYPLVNPDAAIWRAFGDLIGPIFDRIKATGEESDTLAQTRDLLLPKLMSGEIRLHEAERIAEAVP